MSTTIKYKGSTIATAENESKTLLTAGKYMEGNVIVEDVSSGGSDFIITLAADSQQEKWVPDKTFAEISRAVADGLEIALRTDSGDALTDGWWYDDEDPCLAYVVYYYIAGNAYIDAYSLYSNELVLDSREQQFTPNFEVKSVTYSPSTVEQHDTLTPSAGYNGIERVDVLINRVRSAGRTYAALNGSGYITENGQRKWQTRAEFTVGEAGWMSEGSSYGDWEKFPALPSGTAVTPTKQSQSIGAADTMMEGPVTVNPIPSEYIVPSGTKQITENGTANVAEFASVDVNVSGGGGGAAEPNDVEYIDYDGTIVYSYSAADFAQLTAHPANPSHDGLVAQGWNWSLSDAQAYVAEYGGLVIGQMYITESGDSEIDIELHDGRLSPYLSFAPNGTVEIDWGDGSSKDTLTGTSLTTQKSIQHMYSAAGAYTITLHVVSGSFAFLGASSKALLSANGATNYNYVYSNSVKAVRIGSGASIGNYAFSSCNSLASISMPSGLTAIKDRAFLYCYSFKSVSIPNGVTSIGTSAFDYCFPLASVSIPNGVTSIGAYAFRSCQPLRRVHIPNGVTVLQIGTFQNCYSLASISIPSGVTSIENNAVNSCYSLASVSIPSSVTSIGTSTLQNCYGVGEYHVKASTPPTINSYTFYGVPSDCKFYVPAESLEAYKTASNWSNYASKMVGE